MDSNDAQQTETTVEVFNQILREAGTNNYYCCSPSEADPNVLVLKMPRVRNDRSTFVEVIRFTLVGDQEGARVVYFTGNNELSRWWHGKLTAVMADSQARA